MRIRLSPPQMIILGLVLLWALAFVLSFVMTWAIKGPGNMDTGFRRLDVLAKWQIVAFALALCAALAGWVNRRAGRGLRLLGAAPLALTLLIVLAVVVFVQLRPIPAPEAPPGPPTKPAAPALDNG